MSCLITFCVSIHLTKKKKKKKLNLFISSHAMASVIQIYPVEAKETTS